MKKKNWEKSLKKYRFKHLINIFLGDSTMEQAHNTHTHHMIRNDNSSASIHERKKYFAAGKSNKIPIQQYWIDMIKRERERMKGKGGGNVEKKNDKRNSNRFLNYR